MTNWNVLNEMEDLRREINGIFNSVFANGRLPRRTTAFLPGYSTRSYPLVNLYEDANNYFIEALAPGINPEKLELSITGNILTLSGEKERIQDEVKPASYLRSERAAGRFTRSVEVSGEFDSAKVEAHYRNGVILVVLPKTEKVKPKKIEVKVS